MFCINNGLRTQYALFILVECFIITFKGARPHRYIN